MFPATLKRENMAVKKHATQKFRKVTDSKCIGHQRKDGNTAIIMKLVISELEAWYRYRTNTTIRTLRHALYRLF